MRSTLSTIVALASTIQLASATGWTNFPAFNCPANTNNECNSQQSTGFDWSSLNLGSFSTYGDFSFEGFSCASSFGSGTKRDILTGRTFQPKCITGKASSDKSSSPSFGCGKSSSVSAFSITEVQISVEFDCNLEFHYDMPGGSTCKQTSSCKSGGSSVKNTQCGGAKNVTIIYPSQPSGPGKGKDSCSIGVHSVGFDCNTASSTKSHSTSTKSTVTKPTSSNTKPASSTAYTTSVPVVSTTSSKAIVETPSSSSEITSRASTPSTTQFTTSTIISCGPEVKSCPARSTVLTTLTSIVSTTVCPVTPTESTPVSTPSSTSSAIATLTSESSAAPTSSPPAVSEVITTVIIDTTTTLCPVTLTHTTGGTTHIETGVSTSTILLTTTKTVCTKCEEETSTALATTTKPSGPITTAACPDVLPQCLNTWIFLEGCGSNADIDCFCPSADIVSNVFACLSAYGATDGEISAAQSYFQGICAAYIPSNPAIVTCASSISTTAAVQTSVPVTTVSVYTTLVVPCTDTAGSTIPSSSTTTVISTQLTVPQVIFQTVTGTSTAAAVLVTGEASPVKAGLTSTFAPSTTLSASSKTNSTVKASSTPTQQTVSAAGHNSIAIGSIFTAVLFAFML